MSLAKGKLFDAGAFDAALSSSDRPLPLFRDALRHGREHLRQHHLTTTSGADVVYGNAWLLDQLLVRAWCLHLPRLQRPDDLALVAVGGYGRGELHPASDIDLLLLYAGKNPEPVRDFTENLVRFLWDMGLEVGHSLRSLRDCVKESKADITVATNLMEARLLYGDRDLFEKMLEVTAAPKVWPSPKFFEAKWNEQIARHQRFHDTAYNLEPNIKEGPGGLRDIQMIGWVAKRHFAADSLHDLVGHGFLTEYEYRVLIRGRNYLWHLRNGLHFHTGRREDRLLFDHQRALAQQAGLRDRKDSLAVEQLMKRYYRTVKELRLFNEMLLQHFQEEILSRGRARKKELNRRFRINNGFLEVTSASVFSRNPWAMLEMFLLLQQHPEILGVRAQTIRLVRANLHRIDKSFRSDIVCRSLFMEILRQPQGITHALRRMNAYDVLGSYIPAFGRVVGQMQHDLFHVYTVDVHTLFVLRNLRRFTVFDYHDEFPFESDLIRDLVKPERLYLAALFHDIAKGRGGDHSELGARDALEFCRDHGLSEYDAGFVTWLVRNHLLMSWTAQREDISDTDVVIRFAQKIGDQERLDNLYLLTVADIRGTSPKVWNSWKGRLLFQLYLATSRVLAQGFGSPERLEQRAADLKKQALVQLTGDKIPAESIESLWQSLDDWYFTRYDAGSLAWHAQRISQSSISDLPMVAARLHPEHEGIEILVFAPLSESLFPTLTGGIDRLGLNIVDARLHSTRTGFALDTFVVLAPNVNRRNEPGLPARLERELRQQILSPQDGPDPQREPLPRALKQFPIPTRVEFGPSANGQVTVMEVVAQDRPGLLYQVAQALNHARARVQSARVSTFGERAQDTFFITDRDDQPFDDAARQDDLREDIIRRLGNGKTENIVTPETQVIQF